MGRPKYDQQLIDASQLKVPQFCCNFEGCRKYFTKLSQLKYHQNTHLEEKPYKCEYEGCTSAYYRPNHLQRHVLSIHESSEKVKKEFTCPEEGCEASFETEASLYFHAKRKHTCQSHECSFCKKKFGKKWALKEHEAGHTGASPFKCEEENCHQEFKAYKDFRAHKRYHEKITKEVTKTLVCSVDGCTQTFMKWSELVNHKKASHPKESKCPTCNKIFTKGNLKLHMQVHLDNEDRTALVCPVEGCPRFYYHQKNLNHHLRVKHHDQGFECSICHRKLSSKQKLDKHVKVIHEGEGKTGKRKKKAKKATSILKKLTASTEADWERCVPGPPKYIGVKYNCIKFPKPSGAGEQPRFTTTREDFLNVVHALGNQDNSIDVSEVEISPEKLSQTS